MKKTIRYKLIGADPFLNTESFCFGTLKEKYAFVESDAPDYVFSGSWSSTQGMSDYRDCVKIFFCSEPIAPDFIFFDYWIGQEKMDYYRFCSFPVFLHYHRNMEPVPRRIYGEEATTLLAGKKYFCDYIQGHERFDGLRQKLVQEISSYRKVDCFGRHLFDQNPTYLVDNYAKKNRTQAQSKFSLVVEAEDKPCFITEKISQAIAAGSIPIYFGPPEVMDIFNIERFIYGSNKRIDEIISQISLIDKNDSTYLDILSKEPFVNPNFISDSLHTLECFLDGIFALPKDAAIRRTRHYLEEGLRKKLSILNKYRFSLSYLIRKKINGLK